MQLLRTCIERSKTRGPDEYAGKVLEVLLTERGEGPEQCVVTRCQNQQFCNNNMTTSYRHTNSKKGVLRALLDMFRGRLVPHEETVAQLPAWLQERVQSNPSDTEMAG